VQSARQVKRLPNWIRIQLRSDMMSPREMIMDLEAIPDQSVCVFSSSEYSPMQSDAVTPVSRISWLSVSKAK
jgi:hypothetical protein